VQKISNGKNHSKHTDYINMFMQHTHTLKFLEVAAPQVVPVFVIHVKTLLVPTVQCKMVT
jgi:hypothetical protein